MIAQPARRAHCWHSVTWRVPFVASSTRAPTPGRADAYAAASTSPTTAPDRWAHAPCWRRPHDSHLTTTGKAAAPEDEEAPSARCSALAAAVAALFSASSIAEKKETSRGMGPAVSDAEQKEQKGSTANVAARLGAHAAQYHTPQSDAELSRAEDAPHSADAAAALRMNSVRAAASACPRAPLGRGNKQGKHRIAGHPEHTAHARDSAGRSEGRPRGRRMGAEGVPSPAAAATEAAGDGESAGAADADVAGVPPGVASTPGSLGEAAGADTVDGG